MPAGSHHAISVQLAPAISGQLRLQAARRSRRWRSMIAPTGPIPKLIVRVRFRSPAPTTSGQIRVIPPAARWLLRGSSRSAAAHQDVERRNSRVRPCGHQVDRRCVTTDSGYAEPAPQRPGAVDLEPSYQLRWHTNNPEHAVISQALVADSQMSPAPCKTIGALRLSSQAPNC